MIINDGIRKLLDKEIIKDVKDEIEKHIKAYHEEDIKKHLKTHESGLRHFVVLSLKKRYRKLFNTAIKDKKRTLICECESKQFFISKDNIECARCRRCYSLMEKFKW